MYFNYILLFFLILISIELLIKFNYLNYVKTLIILTKKATSLIINKKISDHWKEKIIPIYSYKMMKYSFLMLIIIFLIILLFFITVNYFDYFLEFIFSFKGILGSILISFSYLYFRNLFIK